MNKVLKRFFYFWRLPLIFFILFFVLLFLGDSLEGDAGGLVGAIWLFVDIPCLLFFTARSIFLRIRSAITYHRTKVRDEAFIFPEIDAIHGVIDAISDDLDAFGRLTPQMKARCIIFRLLSVALIIGGIIGCFTFSESTFIIALFALVIIAGATLWLFSNSSSYNSHVKGVRMLPCADDFTTEQLFPFLNRFSTSLGAPRFANVRGFKKPIIVYGSASDSFIYVVYRARFADYFYVSTIYSFSLKDNVPSEGAEANEERTDTVNDEFAFYLEEITEVVEKALTLAGTA